MSDSSREASPDPITLPSSPLSGRPARATRSARRATPARVTARSRASPSKSVVLDTPQAGDASPWRIKVTVQAEPREGHSASPGKTMTRTMSIPLKSPTSQRKASSSAKKMPADGVEKRPTRKRKGTPIRERRSAPALRAQSQVQAAPELVTEPTTEQDEVMPPESYTPPRRASARMARLSAQWSDGTGRTKRLSVARKELDQALEDAIGPYGDAPGDVTLSRAEDFTMLSMESLQSAKEASLAHISHMQIIAEGEGSQRERPTHSVSYLPSSPSKARYPDISASAAKARATLGSPFVPTPQKRSSLGAAFEGKSSVKAKSGLRHEIDAVSWQYTGPPKIRSSPRSSQRHGPHTQTPEPPQQREEETDSVQVQDDDSDEDVLVGDGTPEQSDDELGEGGDEDGDLWQTEASREHMEQPGDEDQAETDEQQDPDFRPTHSPSEAEDPNYKPHSSQPRSQKSEDLFAHIPEKPPRPKIPRTWRRSSGVDFSYVDSPAHQAAAESAVERRQSADGSGVLTPPSTDESEKIEEDDVTAELQGEADDQLRSEYTQAEVENEPASADLHEADDQMHSEFTQPEGEATRFHQDDEMDEDDEDGDDERAQNDSKTTRGSDEISQRQEDSGSFTNDVPQIYLKERPKRRPPRKPTMDLTELLNLNGSPEKVSTSGSKAGNRESPAAHKSSSSGKKPNAHAQSPAQTNMQNLVSNPLRRSLFKSTKLGETALATEEAFNSVRTDELLSNPPQFRHLKELRNSGIRTFDIGGQYPPSRQGQQPPTVPAVPQKRRGRQYFGRNHPNNSQTESTVTDSFASKQSDQRQLLEESAKSSKPQRVHSLRASYSQQAEREHQELQEDRLNRLEENMIQRQEPIVVDTYDEDMNDEEDDCEEEETVEPIRSYEENLNLESPTKIKVNFNESVTANDTSSWLRQSIRQPPLFNVNTPRQQLQPQHAHDDSSSVLTLVDKKPKFEPGLLSRWSSSVWSAVMRLAGPTEIIPTIHTTPYQAPVVFPVTIRSQVRSRYGVLSEEFPWTMAHMRTLHRMLNSTMSGRVDSIIPKKGPLPRELEARIDSIQRSVGGYSWTFTRQHAHIVFTFMQIFVPRDTVEAMKRGEVEMLGDGVAKRIRGYFDPERHGDDEVYDIDWVNVLKGNIFVEFPLSALGDCVKANDVLWQRLQDEGRDEDFERECFGDALARKVPRRAAGGGA